MDQKLELEAKRMEVREKIFVIKNKTSLAITFRLLGILIPKSFSKNNLIYWVCQIILLNAFILLPGLLLSVLLDDFEQSSDLWKPTVIATEFIVLGFLVAYISHQSLFNDIAREIVGKISSTESLSKLINWLKEAWSIKVVATYIIAAWLLYEFLVIIAVSTVRQGFIGFSSALMAISGGFCVAILLHYLVWITLLNFQLRDYQYDLNTLSPADSEAVISISKMSNSQIYLLSTYFAILTLITSLGLFGASATPAVVLPLVIIGWTLITFQFLITRSTINCIVERAKWKTLNKLQAEINQFEAEGTLSDKETLERILRLTEFFNRIRSSRAGTFDWKSLSTFINQLMLPLLGLLLGKLPDILKSL